MSDVADLVLMRAHSVGCAGKDSTRLRDLERFE